MKPFLFLFLLLLNFFILGAQSIEDSLLIATQEITSLDTNKVDAWIELAYYYNERNTEQAKRYTDSAAQLALQLNYPFGIAKSHFALAIHHDHLGAYDQALDYYLKSAQGFEQLNKTQSLSSTYNTLGIFFRKQKNYTRAADYYKKSIGIDLSSSPNDSFSIATNYNNLGNVYADLKATDSCMYYYQKAEVLYTQIKSEKGLASVKTNMGIQYEGMGQLERAEQLYFESLAIAQKHKNASNEMVSYTNLGYLHTSTKNFSKAKTYFELAETTRQQINDIQWKLVILEGLIELAIAQKDYQQAFNNTQIFNNIKDSLFNTEREQSIAQMQARFDLSQKEAQIHQLQQEQKQEQRKRLNTVLILGLLLCLGIVFIAWQRSKIVRERKIAEQQESLLAAEMKSLRLEQEKTKADLEFRDQEITNFALHLVEKNNFIEKIEQSLQKIPITETKSAKHMRDILFQLRQNQLIGNELVEFHKRLNELNIQFFQQLEQEFPQLTKNEKRLAALLRLGLTSKEIAILNHVTEQAVKMSRYRLRKRLDLASDVNLSDFFKNISQ